MVPIFVIPEGVVSILKEELLRSIAWAGLGLFGWAWIANRTQAFEASIGVVAALTILTWAGLTIGMIGLRLATNTELQVQSREGLHIVTLFGIILGGYAVVYGIVVEGWPVLFAGGLYIAVLVAFLAYYQRYIVPQFNAGEAENRTPSH